MQKPRPVPGFFNSNLLKPIVTRSERIIYSMDVLFGRPARSCKDFISQQIDNATLYQAYYLAIVYERKLLDSNLGQHKDCAVTPVEYFKLQAKNLFKDYKTKQPVFDEIIKDYLYQYTPKYFDIDGIVCSFDIDEDDFSLMKAQHIIARLAGFYKWADLLNASQARLELAKLLFDNQDIICAESFDAYIADAEEMNQTTFNTEERIDLFKELFLSGRVSGESTTNFLLKKKSA